LFRELLEKAALIGLFIAHLIEQLLLRMVLLGEAIQPDWTAQKFYQLHVLYTLLLVARKMILLIRGCK
jgi:hypothetical protein